LPLFVICARSGREVSAALGQRSVAPAVGIRMVSPCNGEQTSFPLLHYRKREKSTNIALAGQLSQTGVSGNAGGVKHVSITLLHAPIEERHFAVIGEVLSPNQGSLPIR